MKAVGSSKILVITSIVTQHVNPEAQHLKLHCHGNIKSHIY